MPWVSYAFIAIAAIWLISAFFGYLTGDDSGGLSKSGLRLNLGLACVLIAYLYSQVPPQ